MVRRNNTTRNEEVIALKTAGNPCTVNMPMRGINSFSIGSVILLSTSRKVDVIDSGLVSWIVILMPEMFVGVY